MEAVLQVPSVLVLLVIIGTFFVGMTALIIGLAWWHSRTGRRRRFVVVGRADQASRGENRLTDNASVSSSELPKPFRGDEPTLVANAASNLTANTTIASQSLRMQSVGSDSSFATGEALSKPTSVDSITIATFTQRDILLVADVIDTAKVSMEVALLPDVNRTSEYENPPESPSTANPVRWFRVGETVVIGNQEISCGLFYAGSCATSLVESDDPAVIDVDLPVSGLGSRDFSITEPQLSYAALSPANRQEYLQWLAASRRDRSVPSWCLWLFLYGLERRLLLDGQQQARIEIDLPAIEEELKGFLDAYGSAQAAIVRRVGDLLCWIQVKLERPGLYRLLPRETDDLEDYPLSLKVSLARAADQGRPIPSYLALAWIRSTPPTRADVPSERYRLDFAVEFERRYRKTYGMGVIALRSPVKLRVVYHPANPVLARQGDASLELSSLTDISRVSAPFEKVRALAFEVAEELAPKKPTVAPRDPHTTVKEQPAKPRSLKVDLPSPASEVQASSPSRERFPSRPSQSEAPAPEPTVGPAPTMPAPPVRESIKPAPALPTAPPREVNRGAPSHAIPKPPKELDTWHWYGPGEQVVVAGRSLTHGLIYVGTSIKGPSGNSEPSLINPTLPVDQTGDFKKGLLSRLPDYGAMPPSARAAYLDWLASGRRHPDAALDYVFLFLFGLERRVIVDSTTYPSATADFAAIGQELREILEVYGDRSSTLATFASELLAVIIVRQLPPRLYDTKFPNTPSDAGLLTLHKIALGQVAKDVVPLPVDLALAWVQRSADLRTPTAAKRCPSEFARLFALRYAEKHGAGLGLPFGRTRLTCEYRSVSVALQEIRVPPVRLGHLPDVTELATPIQALSEIAQTTSDELEPFSRFVFRNPTLRDSAEAALELPVDLWNDHQRSALRELGARTRGGSIVVSYREVLNLFSAALLPTAQVIAALRRALASVSVGIEEEPRAPDAAADPKGFVTLHRLAAKDGLTAPREAFVIARSMLQLAAVIAFSDGELGAAELNQLRTSIDAWTHLSAGERGSLHAQLLLLTKRTANLATVGRGLRKLPKRSRESVAAFLLQVAQADGHISVDEERYLTKACDLLGVSAADLLGSIRNAPAKPNQPRTHPSYGLLDQKRVEAVVAETEQVQALLAGLFADDVALDEEVEVSGQTIPQTRSGLLGLDSAHARLAERLLSRSRWNRVELESLARELSVMLDGAIEHINDAAFSRYDLPFCEGEDPLVINPDLVARLAGGDGPS